MRKLGIIPRIALTLTPNALHPNLESDKSPGARVGHD